MQRSDWESDVAAAHEAEKTAYERAQQEIKNRLENQKADEESYSKLKNQYDRNKLMKKAALIQAVGRFGAGLTSANDYELKRLGKWNHQICFTACAKARTVFMSDFIPGVDSGIKVAREIDDPHDKRTGQRMVSKFHDYVAGRI